MSQRVERETIYHETVADGVVLLTLNRPKAGNGVVPEMAADLMACFDELEADKSVRVLIVTGAGKQFCAGADLPGFKHFLDERLAIEQEPFNARVLFPVTKRFVSCRLPIIAAINGGATAGGLDLALACDLRIASTVAKLGETYIKLGLNPGNGGTYFLPRLIGSGMAAEMAYTGDLFDAQRALAVGLVNRVVEPEQLIPASVELAARIAQYSRLALEATKHQLRQSWHMDLSTSLNTSFWGAAALYHGRDLKEGVDAALEKRTPVYNTLDKSDSGK